MSIFSRPALGRQSRVEIIAFLTLKAMRICVVKARHLGRYGRFCQALLILPRSAIAHNGALLDQSVICWEVGRLRWNRLKYIVILVAVPVQM